MNLFTIRPLNAPPHPRRDIVFGQNIHAEAVYSINFDDQPELLALMAPIGKNESLINIMDDLHPETIYDAHKGLNEDIIEAGEKKLLEQQISGWENRK